MDGSPVWVELLGGPVVVVEVMGTTPTPLSFDHIDADDLRRFETYRNYLQRFCSLSRSEHPTWLTLAQACVAGTQALQPVGSLDASWVRRFMGIAWNTECLLNSVPEGADLLRVHNAWLPVQAYYTVYAAAEALSYVIDGEKADGHTKALRKATAFLVKGPLAPWNLAYRGAKGSSGKQHRQMNFPPDLKPEHNLAGAGASDIGVIATCLKAEHQNRIKEDYKGSGKRQYEYDPGVTGLLHFLYRLRIRSNYRGIDVFLVNAGADAHRSFRESLLCVVRRTLTYFEVVLLRKCRRSTLTEMADAFVGRNRLAEQLKNRFVAYKKLY